jgi:transcriptional regulator with XRE-family HTH domain
VDVVQLGDFLRRRREALEPEDAGLVRGPRRRTPGLRREEVAALAGMSVDYYTRLEQRRAPQPSVSVVAAVARALRLTRDESDHLWRLAGHQPPPRTAPSEHVSPALLRVLDRLEDTPAMVVTDLDEVLVQNRMAVALVGDAGRHTGLARSFTWRWFLEPGARDGFPPEDHALHTRVHVANLREAVTRRGRDAGSTALLRSLLAGSEEFRREWERHDVAVLREQRKRIVHPVVGLLDLDCQRLLSESQSQCLLVYTADPGSDSESRLRLLSVVGTQRLGTPAG